MDFIYEERLLWILQHKVDLILSDPEMIKRCDKKIVSGSVKQIHKLKRLLLFTYQHQINLMVDRCEIWSAFELYQFQSFINKIRRLKKYFSHLRIEKDKEVESF